MKHLFLTFLMLPLLANAQCDSVKVSGLSLSMYGGRSSHDTDTRFLRRTNWSSESSDIPIYPFIDPNSMWDEITVVSPETMLQLTYTFNHKEQRKWYQQLDLNVGFHGDIIGYAYGESRESTTIDSMTIQGNSTTYPIDSVTNHEVIETYALDHTVLGLGYHLNYAKGRFLFGFGAECSYYLMSDPSVSVTHRTTVSYSPNVYPTQIKTSYSEYNMEAKSMLFRASIPFTVNFRLFTMDNVPDDGFWSRYGNWWDEHLLHGKEKRTEKVGKFRESHIYLGFIYGPTYMFGTYNNAVISRFGITAGGKLTLMF